MYLIFWHRIKIKHKFTKELTLHIEWISIIVNYYCFTVDCQYHSCFVYNHRNTRKTGHLELLCQAGSGDHQLMGTFQLSTESWPSS